MIIKYISDLLLDHGCVIVPEFGAFITKETPAMLDYVNHVMTPPSKEVAFNGQLMTDDGLLIGYIAEHEGVTTTEAAQMVHDFAMRNLAVLEASGALRLDGMGVLTRVNSREYILLLDDNMNLLGDAYGLTTFKAHPIYRKETYHRLATQIAAEQKTKNTEMTVLDEEKVEMPHHVNHYNYKWFRAAAYSLMIATVLVFLGWGADKSDSKFASWNPFFYASPNEFIAKHLEAKSEAREAVYVDKLPFLTVELPIFKKDINYLQPIDVEVVKPVNHGFYIIGASFKNEKEAQKCATKFQKLGFSNAMVLPRNDKGNMRVVYDMFVSEEQARKQLEIIKKEYNEAAWLLRK